MRQLNLGRIALVALAAACCLQPAVLRADQVKLLGKLPYEGYPKKFTAAPVAFSADGKLLAANWGVGLFIYDAKTGRPHVKGEAQTNLNSLHFLPNGRVVFGPVVQQEKMQCFDPASGKLLSTVQLPGSTDERTIALSPRGDLFAMSRTLVGGPRFRTIEVSLFDLATGKQLRRALFEQWLWAWDLEFSPDGDTLAFSQGEGIALLKTDDLSIVKTLGVEDDRTRELAFSPDGRWLASTYQNGTAKVWDIAAGEVLQGFREDAVKDESRWYEAIAFAPDGRTFVVGGGDVKGLSVNEGPSYLALFARTRASCWLT